MQTQTYLFFRKPSETAAKQLTKDPEKYLIENVSKLLLLLLFT